MKPISTIPVIAIDGPSGSGKGTISRLLAKSLGWHFLDSGAIYRALAWLMLNTQVAVTDNKWVALAEKMDLQFEGGDVASPLIRLNGQDVTQALLTETYGEQASKIAIFPEVRALLLEKQRHFRQSPGLVADGRDMGSVVFPDATLKIFLSASLSERAQRRYNQLKAKGINVNLHTILDELKVRDARDEQRQFAPLKPAKDAINVDTTNLTIPQVVKFIENRFKSLPKISA